MAKSKDIKEACWRCSVIPERLFRDTLIGLGDPPSIWGNCAVEREEVRCRYSLGRSIDILVPSDDAVL